MPASTAQPRTARLVRAQEPERRRRPGRQQHRVHVELERMEIEERHEHQQRQTYDALLERRDGSTTGARRSTARPSASASPGGNRPARRAETRRTTATRWRPRAAGACSPRRDRATRRSPRSCPGAGLGSIWRWCRRPSTAAVETSRRHQYGVAARADGQRPAQAVDGFGHGQLASIACKIVHRPSGSCHSRARPERRRTRNPGLNRTAFILALDSGFAAARRPE